MLEGVMHSMPLWDICHIGHNEQGNISGSVHLGLDGVRCMTV